MKSNSPEVRPFLGVGEARLVPVERSVVDEVVAHLLAVVDVVAVLHSALVVDDERRWDAVEVAVGIVVAPQIEPRVQQRHGHEGDERQDLHGRSGEPFQLGADESDEFHGSLSDAASTAAPEARTMTVYARAAHARAMSSQAAVSPP